MARKELYEDWCTPERLIVIRGWAMDGLTDEQIAANIGIGRTTFYKWRKEHPEFAQAIAVSKAVADREIENALFKAARRGNVTAMIYWLKNRKPDEWRDRRDPDITSDLLAKVDEVTVRIKEAAEGNSAAGGEVTENGGDPANS